MTMTLPERVQGGNGHGYRAVKPGAGLLETTRVLQASYRIEVLPV